MKIITREAVNHRSERTLAEAKIVSALFYLGMGSGVLMSPTYNQEHQAAKDFIGEEKDKKNPPKPPSRPNIPIGRIAPGSA
jgi:hypothetical protein